MDLWTGLLDVLILLLAAMLRWEIPALRVVAENTLEVLVFLHMVAGIAIGHCLSLQLRMGALMRLWVWFVLLFLALDGQMRYVIAAIGLFDNWVHFRRWGAKLGERRDAR